MLSEKSINGKGLYVSLEETETREGILEKIVLTAIREEFAAEGKVMPEDITEKAVSKFIFAGPVQQGQPIVKPFWIQGVFVRLFIKQTDSPTKIEISPLYGLCPGVIKTVVRELLPQPMDPVPMTPLGTFPESLH